MPRQAVFDNPNERCLFREWREVPILEYSAYRVSNLGEVLSSNTKGRLGKILKPVQGRGGYLEVTLSVKGKKKTYYIHYLVLLAFSGPRPEGKVACHWDDDKLNNKLTNLRWGTKSDNQLDWTQRNKPFFGGYNHQAKLTEGAVRFIRTSSLPQKELASRYKVSRAAIYMARNRLSWRNVL